MTRYVSFDSRWLRKPVAVVAVVFFMTGIVFQNETLTFAGWWAIILWMFLLVFAARRVRSTGRPVGPYRRR